MPDEQGPDAPEGKRRPDPLANLERSIEETIRNSLSGNGMNRVAGLPAPDLQPVQPVVGTRLYLPTLADLIDRLTICQLKAIHIPEHAEDYRAEIDLILHDIDVILSQWVLDAEAVRAIAVLMLTNHFVWINESKARAGGSEQDHLLRATHSINGVRNTAKNVIASKTGGRKDYKIDAFAADLPAEFRNWNIFGQR